MKKFLLSIPWYIKKGYLKKLFQYIKYNGLFGLKDKIKRVLKGNVHNVPVYAFTNNKLKEVLCGNISKIRYNKSVIKHIENIDIIICVYNAYEDVKSCIESVFEYSSEPYNIIIVDDGSDELVKNYLESLKNSCTNIELFRNEKSKGYTRAANIGLKYSNADYCILLNSDTIVTENWLDKLVNCIKSDSKAGIAGPLSNTASWQSVPSVYNIKGDWASNDLHENINLDQYAKLIEKYSGKIFPSVPLLNGFCIMLNRSVIDSIGYFDEDNFGSGFGEEDDYCLRAGKAGFKILLADDTYIFHSQSKSYSDQRRIELCNENGQKQRRKHGDELLDTSVSIMKHNFVLHGIRSRINILEERKLLIENTKNKWEGKRILILLPINESGGGGNVIIQEASCMIEMGIDVWLYNLARFKKDFIECYPQMEIPVIYGEKIDSFKTYADDFDIICATQCSTVEYCDFKNFTNTRAAYYIQDFEPDFFIEGSDEYNNALDSYTLLPNINLVTKTEWNKLAVSKYTGAQAKVIGKSVDIDLYRPVKLFPNKDKMIITAMVRPYSQRRAPQMTLSVLNEIAKKYSDNISIMVFGSDPEESDVDRNFWNENKKEDQVINLGKLKKFEVASLLQCTDIFTDFSSFQAMGLTSMEAMACGCAVIVPKNGGSVEFVDDGKNGIVVDTTNKSECIKALCRLIDDREYLYKLSYKAISDICRYYPEKCASNFLDVCFG